VWAATAAGDADAVVRWDSCRLDFFVSFLVKQKRKRRKMGTKIDYLLYFSRAVVNKSIFLRQFLAQLYRKCVPKLNK
jgi:hypothetical protein